MSSKPKQSEDEEASDIPAGKVGCPLCGGFISVQGGDRARFIDHMSNEHDARTDCHEILLALSVLDIKEQGFIIKSSGPRLDEIGKGNKPDFSKSFLSKLTSGSAPHGNRVIIPNANGQSRRGSMPLRGQVNSRFRHPQGNARVRHPQVRQAVTPAASVPPAPAVRVPTVLQGNSSISIAKVDMRRKCNMCSEVLPSPGALADHMNSKHLSTFGGINITSKDNQLFPKKSFKEDKLLVKNSIPTPVLSNTVRPSRSSLPPGAQPPIRKPQAPYNPHSPIIRNVSSGNRMQQTNRRASSSTMECVKCDMCSKTVEKSKLSVHKLTHNQDRKSEKINMVKTVMRSKSEDNRSRRQSQVVDPEVIAIESDSDPDDPAEVSSGKSSMPSTTKSSKKKGKCSDASKDVECKICNKKLANFVALKMHNNLKHPVKTEVDNAQEEKLLQEEGTSETNENELKNEIDNMETMELLDNLVNILNDNDAW